ncbi:small heat shock protein OV25-2-like [Anticarsia gemmatalis]|uniref:small heat shock protein OV25-2-like n=1 Tax=Anticarsia gemmatalis TaxID=129554 RepID=UPI003F775EF7
MGSLSFEDLRPLVEMALTDFELPDDPVTWANKAPGLQEIITLLRAMAQHVKHIKNGAEVSVCNNYTRFHVNLDLPYFEHEEVSVSLRDGSVIIEAEHEEKEVDEGTVARRIVRRYPLPAHTDLSDLTATMSDDGVFTIKAMVYPARFSTDRQIPVRIAKRKRNWEEAKMGNDVSTDDTQYPAQRQRMGPGMGHGAPSQPARQRPRQGLQ